MIGLVLADFFPSSLHFPLTLFLALTQAMMKRRGNAELPANFSSGESAAAAAAAESGLLDSCCNLGHVAACAAFCRTISEVITRRRCCG